MNGVNGINGIYNSTAVSQQPKSILRRSKDENNQ